MAHPRAYRVQQPPSVHRSEEFELPIELAFNVAIWHRLQSFTSITGLSAGALLPLYQVLVCGTCDRLCYVGPWSSQLVAFATWDLWSLPLRKISVAPTTWDLCSSYVACATSISVTLLPDRSSTRVRTYIASFVAMRWRVRGITLKSRT